MSQPAVKAVSTKQQPLVAKARIQPSTASAPVFGVRPAAPAVPSSASMFGAAPAHFGVSASIPISRSAPVFGVRPAAPAVPSSAPVFGAAPVNRATSNFEDREASKKFLNDFVSRTADEPTLFPSTSGGLFPQTSGFGF